jgi:hypothetical protein
MHGSVFDAKGSRARNLGWAGLVLPALAGLLSAGYALGLLGDWGELRPSLTKTVPSSADDGNPNVTGVIGSIGARQVEVPRFSERARADNSARASVVEAPANAPAEASESAQIERLINLMKLSEATWAEGYKAERERADGIARDLASVRAELATRVAAEAALRAEVVRMAKLLGARETGSKKLAADRKKSKGVVKDSASSAHALADRAAAPKVFAVQSSPPASSSTGMAKLKSRKPANGVKRQESLTAKNP